MLSVVAVSFGVLGLSILFSFAPLLLSCLFSIFKQVCVCKFLNIKVLREKGAITRHYRLPGPPLCLRAQATVSPRLRQTPEVQGNGAPMSTQLSQWVTSCKSKVFFFNYSPSEYYGADENILYFLQPFATGADDFLCIDPGGIIQITYMVLYYHGL